MRHTAWIVIVLVMGGCANSAAPPQGHVVSSAERQAKRDREQAAKVQGMLVTAHSLEDFSAAAHAAVPGPVTLQKEVLRQRRVWYIQAHPEMRDSIKDCIGRGALAVGMTEEQAYAGLGSPIDQHRIVTAYGTDDQWEFGFDVPHIQYAYFRDGVLTGWQEP